MLARTYYADKQVEITDDTVKGPAGVFGIRDVVGIEAKLPTARLLIHVAIALPLIPLTAEAHGTLLYIAWAAWMINGLTFVGHCLQRRVIVRTLGGAVPLGVLRDASDRRKMSDAFVRAKNARLVAA